MKSENEVPEIRRSVVVPCGFGLNLLVASRVVRLARRYESEICLERGRLKADAKSVLSILLLEAIQGKKLSLAGRGADAEGAVKAISELFESREVLCGEGLT